MVYVSATGATEPKHMAYMTRLGLWGPGTAFADFRDFHKRIDEAGVAAMEMVAMEMKAVRRPLSAVWRAASAFGLGC